MVDLFARIQNALYSKRGQGLAEYALLVAAIVAIVAVVALLFGDKIAAFVNGITLNQPQYSN